MPLMVKPFYRTELILELNISIRMNMLMARINLIKRESSFRDFSSKECGSCIKILIYLNLMHNHE